MDEKQIEAKREKEKRTVSFMIEIYCKGNHKPPKGTFCDECEELKAYAIARAERCPHMATKTFCSKCKTHCYKPEMRDKIRKVMRYSGPRMVIYSPLMFIRHAFESLKK
ncbi:MAG: nitrous oxide-stimulated promoter family protein [Fibrobacter sp.]|nr:nitrous oxide-stimulated promoter family protein [Fibrobacter sp.]